MEKQRATEFARTYGPNDPRTERNIRLLIEEIKKLQERVAALEKKVG